MHRSSNTTQGRIHVVELGRGSHSLLSPRTVETPDSYILRILSGLTVESGQYSLHHKRIDRLTRFRTATSSLTPRLLYEALTVGILVAWANVIAGLEDSELNFELEGYKAGLGDALIRPDFLYDSFCGLCYKTQ